MKWISDMLRVAMTGYDNTYQGAYRVYPINGEGWAWLLQNSAVVAMVGLSAEKNKNTIINIELVQF